MQNALRTQIILPKALRMEIDRARQSRGESLAEYLRVAAEERLAREKRRRADYRALAEEVVGAARGASGWDGVDVEEWQRSLRADR